jgi:hypothetical protein
LQPKVKAGLTDSGVVKHHKHSWQRRSTCRTVQRTAVQHLVQSQAWDCGWQPERAPCQSPSTTRSCHGHPVLHVHGRLGLAAASGKGPAWHSAMQVAHSAGRALHPPPPLSHTHSHADMQGAWQHACGKSKECKAAGRAVHGRPDSPTQQREREPQKAADDKAGREALSRSDGSAASSAQVGSSTSTDSRGWKTSTVLMFTSSVQLFRIYIIHIVDAKEI